MKKLIVTIVLILSMIESYSQSFNLNANLTLSNIIPVDVYLHKTEATALTVPVDKVWVVQIFMPTSYSISFKPPGFSTYLNTNAFQSTSMPIYLIAGTKLYLTYASNGGPVLLNITEFNAPISQTGTLSVAENILKNVDKIEIFPNPTNSRITLNSDKHYDIEIYDMQGRIVKKDNGNTIDLTNLANAVYILKAYDTYEKTILTYKVVKN